MFDQEKNHRHSQRKWIRYLSKSKDDKTSRPLARQCRPEDNKVTSLTRCDKSYSPFRDVNLLKESVDNESFLFFPDKCKLSALITCGLELQDMWKGLSQEEGRWYQAEI